jgi:hypothetical protein
MDGADPRMDCRIGEAAMPVSKVPASTSRDNFTRNFNGLQQDKRGDEGRLSRPLRCVVQSRLC